MNKLIFVIASLYFSSLCAQDCIPTGLFFGLGGSYNCVKIDQQLDGNLFSSVFSGPSLVSLGETDASISYHTTQSTLAPYAQLGFLYSFCHWFMSAKACYQYLGLTFTQSDFNETHGSLYQTVGIDNWVGHFQLARSETTIDHELYFLPLFGYCFDPSSIYLGIGAALFRLEQHLSGLGGLARINGAVSDSPNTFASLNHSQWVWGGIAQIGWVHSFTSSWFLDLNYS